MAGGGEPTATGRVVVSREGAVARILLDRPAKLNAITPEMSRELFQHAAELNGDDSVRAVVVTGAGDRAFCAGSDIGRLDDHGTSWQYRNELEYPRAIWSIRKPVIAAIRGYAVGGGLEIALACDIRLATPDARFGAPEIKRGWHGSAGNTQLLPRLVGYGKAMELLLTGDLVEAGEAERIGLIERVVTADELAGEASALARRIATKAPIAVQMTKHLVRIAESTPVEVGLAYEKDAFSYTFTTADAREGKVAFTEGREPEFRGE